MVGMLNNPSIKINSETIEQMVLYAWECVDLMQTEADKRKVVGVPETIRESRSLTKDPDGWQPDWSQAPDWAVAWTMDAGEILWWSHTPWFKNGFWFVDDSISWQCGEAPSFDYKGDWCDSLRGRPL